MPPKSISILHESLYSFPECRMFVPRTLTVNEKLLDTRGRAWEKKKMKNPSYFVLINSLMKFCWTILLLILINVACKKTNTDSPTPPNPPPVSIPDTLQLLNTSYKPGNQVNNAQDTFNLIFNHTVTINSIQLKNTGCLPDFKFKTINNGKTVQFYNFLCGGLGGDYTFGYTVTDSAAKQHSGTVSFHCYTRRINFNTLVLNYFISKDNQYCWILTNSPNQLLCIGITDTSYRKSYSLSFRPFKAVFNYDNNKIYILPIITDVAHRDSIYVFEPTTGTVEKKIFVPRSFDNREQFSEDLAFGANGYGMVKVVDDNSSPGWFVIDSRIHDTLYRHPSFVVGSVSYLYSFKMCYSNYDGSKVLGLEEGGSCRLVVLDCNTHVLSELAFPPSPHCYSSYFVVNKLKDQLYMVNLQTTGDGQFLVSNGSIVGTSDFDAYGNSEADFVYRANSNNQIYYFDNHVFGVVNYSIGSVLSMYGFANSIDKIAATTNGKYIVSRGDNCLVFFDTDMF